MIRGWRLDPRWVEYYARRDAGRQARKMEIIEIEREKRKLEKREFFEMLERQERKEYLQAVKKYGVPNAA